MRWIATALLLATLTAPAQEFRNNPPIAAQRPSSEDQARIIEKAREIALEYTSKLPDFLATQTSRRLYLPTGSKTWKAEDTLVFEVTFIGGDERYTLLTINGKPTTKKREDLDGLKVGGEFGTLLFSLFKPQSETKFKWERLTDVRGRLAHVYSYQVDKDRSDYNWRLVDDKEKEYAGVLAYRGEVYIDHENHQTLGLQKVGQNFPADWPVSASSTQVDYGFVTIAGKSFLLPLHAETHVHFKSMRQHRTVVEFSNYRRFTTGVTIKPADTPHPQE
jgi:hypothetical protein